MLKYSDVILQPLHKHKFKVVKPFKFKDIEIPENFTTDGATVPRVFWPLFPPNRTDYLPCAIVHDYLCDKEEYKKADQYFKECLECLGVDKFSRTLMYLAVRLYHKLKYHQ